METITTTNLWNDGSLLPPPVNTYKVQDSKHIDICTLHTVVTDAIYVLENQKVLHKEAAVISRLIYMMCRKFRHDIGFSYVKKTNGALLKYLNLKIIDDLNTLNSLIPVELSAHTYLPTRQMIEYVLLRLQTFSQIMCRVVVCARKAATFFLERIKRGDSAWLSLMPYTVLSRVWVLSKHLVKNACKWYDTLLPFAFTLNAVGGPFLPRDYNFPKKLDLWLDIDWLDEQANLLWKSKTLNFCTGSDTTLVKNNNDFAEIKMNDDDDLKNEDVSMHPNYGSISLVKQMESKSCDIGEVISRNQYLKSQSLNKPSTVESPKNIHSINDNMKDSDTSSDESSDKCYPNKNNIDKKDTNKNKYKNLNNMNVIEKLKPEMKKIVHSIDALRTKEGFNKFLKREESFRTNVDERSLTSHLGFMQWESLKKLIIPAISKIDDEKPNLKHLKKVQRIWKERCAS